ncbi:GlsB/YeaQ/YmgE family stress response membrane protein [Haloarchaeobius sp. DYHT-AS-18]|uniref:GlsB/YeaQ/YmgE family stress response membrane protein n=1 Tax=Haloarchaeobius sp. DYHT-AS-18 TaxID=3446117 RepID=UPI003EB90C7D
MIQIIFSIVLGAIGAVIGGSIVTLFGPVIEQKASRFNIWFSETYKDFERPDVDVSLSKSKPYEPGDPIAEFREIDQPWKTSHHIVEIEITPESDRPIQDLKSQVAFDGAYIDKKLLRSSYPFVQTTLLSRGDYYIKSEDRTYHQVAHHGAINIHCDHLPPEESISLRFLVDDDWVTEPILHEGVSDSYVEYSWEHHGFSYSEKVVAER